MPIVAHNSLETLQRLKEEGLEVLDLKRANSQDIRELHIGLLNMMPDGALRATERQFLRLIGSSNRIAQFFVHIFTINGVPRSAETQSYIDANYEKFSDLQKEGLDALIITGTNPTSENFADEPYLDELKEVFAWGEKNVCSVLCSCLASHAAFKYFYQIDRRPLPEKLFGVFSQKVLDRSHPLMSNINSRFDMPHSRKNTVLAEDLTARGLHILVAGEETGFSLATSPDGLRNIYLQGHPEYDVHSLLKEYRRDLLLYRDGKLAQKPPLPAHYFNTEAQKILDVWLKNPQEDFPEQKLAEKVDITWRDTAKAIFANWLGLIYELTHFERQKQYMDGINPENPLEGIWKH
ncbi:MAG: homoserine O-succinyltransferase [Cardiobacteriaceae bacterium]|nr:homoserine O-succinyltransferase [Cardiobacteriaceae bacterium]